MFDFLSFLESHKLADTVVVVLIMAVGSLLYALDGKMPQLDRTGGIFTTIDYGTGFEACKIDAKAALTAGGITRHPY